MPIVVCDGFTSLVDPGEFVVLVGIAGTEESVVLGGMVGADKSVSLFGMLVGVVGSGE